MDPLSISGSVAGLVSLADLVFRAAVKYQKEAKEARKEVDDLLSEVKKMSLLLHNLSLVAFELEASTTGEGAIPNLQLEHLHDCRVLLRQLEQGLLQSKKKFELPSGLNKLQARLKWPFSASDTREMIKTLRNHQSFLNTAITADSLVQLQLCLSTQKDTNNRIKGLQDTTQKILDIQTAISLDTRKREVLTFFTKGNPQGEFETNRRLRHPLTGLWLSKGEAFSSWYDTPNARIWLSGIPGGGKSVIASAAITECLERNSNEANSGRAIGYYFCTYRDPRSHKATAILSSLAAQLARQDARAYEMLAHFYNDLRTRDLLPRDPTWEELAMTLGDMSKLFDRVYLVIDGLDECGAEAGATVKSLLSLAIGSQQNINTALLSRDELFIREKLEDHFEWLEIEAHTEDVQLYVASELEERISSKSLRLSDLALRDHILTELVNGAKGMFRWVTCQLDHLCELPTNRARREALLALPPTLNETYERILMRVESYSKQIRQLVQSSIQLIAVRGSALTARMICEAVSVPTASQSLDLDEIVEEQEILRWCGSLVRRSNDGERIEFSHFTVREYLQTECPGHQKLNVYAVTEESIASFVGPLCLRYLNLKTFAHEVQATSSEIEDIHNRNKSRPFYEYAAINWAEYIHTIAWETHEDVKGPLHELFSPKKTANFCAWAIELIRHCISMNDSFHFRLTPDFGTSQDVALEYISAVLRPDFTPLHMAAVLGFPHLCRHLLHMGMNINLRSKFGTALHFAVGHLLVFSDADVVGGLQQTMGELRLEYARPSRRATVQSLIDAGAETKIKFETPFRSAGLLSLAIDAAYYEYNEDSEIVADLLRSGAVVEDGDLDSFEYFYDHARITWQPEREHGNFEDGGAFKNLLEALSSSDSEENARLRLHTKTLHFLGQMKIKVSTQTTRIAPADEATNHEIMEYLYYIVQNNDVSSLEEFLHRSTHSELVKAAVFGFGDYHSSWTALHLAIQSGSLDSFRLLLEAGCDPNIAADDGRTPAHFCYGEDAADQDFLQLLLQYGASTTTLDDGGRSIWHLAAVSPIPGIAKVLVGCDDSEVIHRGLQLVSAKGETPICAAIASQLHECVQVFLPHCDAKEHWKSNGSIFRQAATLGSSAVIEKLLEVGVDIDGLDDTGSPMHFLGVNASVQCMNLLVGLFDVKQRPKNGLRRPFEDLILRSLHENAWIDLCAFKVLLPESKEIDSREAGRIWSFMSSVAFPKAFSGGNGEWLEGVLSYLLELNTFEFCDKGRRESFVLSICRAAIREMAERPESPFDLIFTQRFGEQSKVVKRVAQGRHWVWISSTLKIVLESSKVLKYLSSNTTILQLLQESIIHDDRQLIDLLLESGVDVHAKNEQVSAFELACFSGIALSRENFERILESSRPEHHNTANDTFGGCGPLHITSGRAESSSGKARLLQLLQAGVDLNLPLSDLFGSPVCYHMLQGSVDTALALLLHGANPWTPCPSSGLNTAGAAICSKNSAQLYTILQLSEERGHTPNWDQRFSLFDKNWTGGNALHICAAYDEAEGLQFLLDGQHLQDVSTTDDCSHTPMHYAAIAGNSEIIKLLVKNGGNINGASKDGSTPLHLAAKEGHQDAVHTLLGLGATQAADHTGFSPLMYAYGTGNTVICRELEAEASFLPLSDSITDPKGLSIISNVLRTAIMRGDLDLCKRLRAAGCPMNIELNPMRQNPLACAIWAGSSPELLQWLIENGVYVSVALKNQSGRVLTAVHWAIFNPQYNNILPVILTKYYEEGGDLATGSDNIFLDAIFGRNVEGLKIVLDFLQQMDATSDIASTRSAMPNSEEPVTVNDRAIMSMINRRDYSGRTPLHEAAKSNQLEAVKILISNHADINAIDSFGGTPLHYAVQSEALEIARCLLDAGSPIDIRTHQYKTPITIAEGELNMVNLLIERGASLNMSTVGSPNEVMSMLRAGSQITTYQLIEMITQHNIDVYKMDALGFSLAHLILSNCQSYLSLLLGGHIQLSRLSESEWPSISVLPPLLMKGIVASMAKNAKILYRYLTKNDLEFFCDLRNPGRHNFLCQAAYSGMIPSVENLLDVGAEIEYRCETHGTPLMAAISAGHLDMVQYLVRRGANTLFSEEDSQSCDKGWDASAIAYWLVVTRHIEQKKLSDVSAGQQDRETSSWSGIMPAAISLKWEWQKSRYESMIEYAKRRERIVRVLRGVIIEPLSS